LEEDDGGNLLLNENHPYYSQVQLQMKLYGASYCDFIVWRQNEMFIQQVPFNVIFISEALDKIPPFIKLCILPELVGKWFTHPVKPSGDSMNEVSSDVVQESYDGSSIEVNATVSSDAAHSSTQYSLQVCGEDCDQESEEDITLWYYRQKDLPEEELVGCELVMTQNVPENGFICHVYN